MREQLFIHDIQVNFKTIHYPDDILTPFSMAETVGLAASIVGLIGLAGKLTEGCIYLRSFFEGVKNAPEDVQLIYNELEILLGASKAIETRLEAGVLDGMLQEAEFRPALEQCVRTVETLGK